MNETVAPQQTKPNYKAWATLGLVCLALAGLVTYIQLHIKKPTVVNQPDYVAVFLTNGQVYFGNLQGTKLLNAYVIQANTDGAQQLIKVSTSVYTPTGDISFNQANIAYTESLQPTSQIVQAIQH